MGRRKKLRNINILVVEHEFKLYLDYTLFLTAIYLKDENEEDYHLVKRIDEDDLKFTSISEHIARVLANWFWGEYDYEVERNSEDGYCEYCGYYTNTQTIITFNDDRLQPIKLYEDEHLGGSYGYSNEDIINDWKQNNVTIEFKEVC